MSYKRIEFQEGKIKETWVGSVSNLIQAHPNAKILNVHIIKEESEQEQEQSPNQSLIKKHFSLIS